MSSPHLACRILSGHPTTTFQFIFVLFQQWIASVSLALVMLASSEKSSVMASFDVSNAIISTYDASTPQLLARRGLKVEEAVSSPNTNKKLLDSNPLRLRCSRQETRNKIHQNTIPPSFSACYQITCHQCTHRNQSYPNRR